MKDSTAVPRRENGTPIKLVPVDVLLNRMQELHDAIARRAYELFEWRGRQHGHDLEDWLQAESEILRPCRHDLWETDEGIVLRAEVPGTFTPDQFQISVEPRRLIISAQRELIETITDENGSREELRRQNLLRVHNLPEAVDPSKSYAKLEGETLEVCMPKLATANAQKEKTEEVSS